MYCRGAMILGSPPYVPVSYFKVDQPLINAHKEAHRVYISRSTYLPYSSLGPSVPPVFIKLLRRRQGSGPSCAGSLTDGTFDRRSRMARAVVRDYTIAIPRKTGAFGGSLMWFMREIKHQHVRWQARVKRGRLSLSARLLQSVFVQVKFQ